MKKLKPIIWGITIIALGVLFGGSALGLFNINIFFDGWWTLLIIVPSAIALLTEKEKLSSLGFLGAGVVLLLAAQKVFSYDVAWKVIVAVFLVVIGLTIIFRGAICNKNDKEVEKKVREIGKDGEMDALTAIFSGNERTYSDEEFSGANLFAVFGGVKLDLRRAKFTKDTVIKACCAFGGIDIIVPETVQVKIKSGIVLGGISDERKGDTEKGKYTIYLEAAGAFGGIEITDKDKQ